jgi:ParB family transcriptional regulator, chromosome partitioning protein
MSGKLVFYLDVDEIKPDPNQPRQTIDPDDVASTALTIEKQGQINPIEINGGNMIVTGEVRWRAVRKAAEMNPDNPDMRLVKCVRWSGSTSKRFERQVVENLHHHDLTEGDMENAIVKLWETGEYPTMGDLAKSVGLTRSRISSMLEANIFRQKQPSMSAAGISTRAISDTAGLDDETRVKILNSVAEGEVLGKDVRDLKKIAQSGSELLEKALEGSISVERALEGAETVKKIEAKGVALSTTQKQNLANKMAEDEKLIEKYEDEVLQRVQRTITTPPSPRENISEPIGRSSPVNSMITVRDTIRDNFQRHIGNCDMSERAWARRILVDIQKDVNDLLALISDD